MKGLTLIELMILVVILGILAAIAIPNFISIQDRAREYALAAVLVESTSALTTVTPDTLINDPFGEVDGKGWTDKMTQTEAGYGKLEYPSYHGNNLVVWAMNDSSGCGYGVVGGIIDQNTHLRVYNRPEFKVGDLDLLNGREVVAMATTRTVGEGEGSKEYITDITIFVPDDTEDD